MLNEPSRMHTRAGGEREGGEREVKTDGSCCLLSLHVNWSSINTSAHHKWLDLKNVVLYK